MDLALGVSRLTHLRKGRQLPHELVTISQTMRVEFNSASDCVCQCACSNLLTLRQTPTLSFGDSSLLRPRKFTNKPHCGRS